MAVQRRDTLLNCCFEGFQLLRRATKTLFDDGRDDVYFIVFRVVPGRVDNHVLVLKVEDDVWKQKAELRYRAEGGDARSVRFGALVLDDCPTNHLLGIGVLGTPYAPTVVTRETFELTPTRAPRPDPLRRVLPPRFLAEEWDSDVLS